MFLFFLLVVVIFIGSLVGLFSKITLVGLILFVLCTLTLVAMDESFSGKSRHYNYNN